MATVTNGEGTLNEIAAVNEHRLQIAAAYSKTYSLLFDFFRVFIHFNILCVYGGTSV